MHFLLRLALLGSICLGFFSLQESAQAQVGLSLSFDFFSTPDVGVSPPPLPVYEVPEPPDDGYVWSPGYWRWDGYDYFWVPGTWVQPPQPDVLWTPGYWGWGDGSYRWHEGYWGPHVGFYGGIHYGGGYSGHGFDGGGWRGGSYHVNRSVTNVTNITNITYNRTTSFNGGPGGIAAVPTAQERAAASEHHIRPTEGQISHARTASTNQALRASVNHGKPAIAATAKAGDFSHGVVVARRAGPPNPVAEKHNASILKNPSMAKGAAVPKSYYRSGSSRSNTAKPKASARAEARAKHEASARAEAGAKPEARADSEGRSKPDHQEEARRPSEEKPKARAVKHPMANPEQHSKPAKTVQRQRPTSRPPARPENEKDKGNHPG